MTSTKEDLVTLGMMVLLSVTMIGGALLFSDAEIADTTAYFEAFLYAYTPTPRPVPTPALPPGTTRFFDYEASVVCYQTAQELECMPLGEGY